MVLDFAVLGAVRADTCRHSARPIRPDRLPDRRRKTSPANWTTDNGQGALRCDISATWRRARAGRADRELERGGAFETKREGQRRAASAAGDADHGPVHSRRSAYGEVWQRSGVHLPVGATELTCFNATQRGFSLARAKQEVFWTATTVRARLFRLY